MAIKSWAVGCVLAATTMAAQPLSLGKERGAAWIGQALELSVPVQLDPGETDICAQADVFHADSRQDPARVRVTLEPAGAADARTLRIYSANPVDEPVVSVYLSTGCTQKSTRKYVLLADFPNSPAVPAVPAVPAAPDVSSVPSVPATPSAPAAATKSAAPASAPPTTVYQPNALAGERATSPGLANAPSPAAQASAQTAPANTANTANTATTTSASARAPAAAPGNPAPHKKASTAPKATTPSTPGKPRLQLDPMDTVAGATKLPDANPGTPAARDAERIARLQQDVRALLEQAAKNEASLLALQVQLLQAQAQPAWATGLLYALVALTLGCVLGIALMWLRGRVARN